MLSILAIGAACLVFLCVAFVTRFLLLESLIGVGLGVLIAPLMNTLQDRFRIPRGLSAVLFIVLVLGGVGGLGYGLFILLSDQLQLLASKAPEIVDSIRSQSERILDRYPWLEVQISKLNLGQAARTTIPTVFQGLQTSLGALAGVIVVLTLALFVAINAKPYFRKWFKSQLIVMAISGSATTLALWILGIDYWLLLGVLTAVLGFIPYIGSFITVIAAGLVTLGSEPDKIWWVLGIYFGIQELESDVTMPLVMKGGVRLPEAHTIVFMLVMANLFGLLGVFAATPLLAVVRNIYLMTYLPKVNAKVAPPSRGLPEPRAEQSRSDSKAA